MRKKSNTFFRILIVFVFFAFANTTKAATIYFNDIFKGTGSNYLDQTSSIVNIQNVVGTGFRFTSANPADPIFIETGNNVAGTLQYTNNLGILISIAGVISRQDKQGPGNPTVGLYFVVSPTPNEAYLLAMPGFSGYSNGQNINTSSDPILAAMNAVLSNQQGSYPIIAVNSPSEYEDGGHMVFTVSLNKTSASNISFTPSLTAVTATPNSPADYQNSMEYYNGSTWIAVSSSVTIAAGTTSIQIRVPIVLDNRPESSEYFDLITGATSGGSVLNGDGTYGIGTINERIVITISSGSLAAFSACSGSASSAQSFTISGTGLSNNIDITAPTGYEVSSNSGSSYASSVILTHSSGIVSTTTILARLTSSASGSPGGNIACSSGLVTQHVIVSGTVTATTTTSAAGSDVSNVSGVTPVSVTLAANNPSVGTGIWSIESGPSTNIAQLNSTSSPTASFTNAGGQGVYTLRWTINNLPCPASYDEMTITVSYPLPVTWYSFTAKKLNNFVLLKWATASELNTKDFILQHRSNSTIWNNVGSVNAAGSSNSIRNYSFSHSTPIKGNNFYRILQRDLDGKYSFSEIRIIKFESKTKDFSVIENPVSGGLLKLQINNTSNLSLYSNSGQFIWEKKFEIGIQSVNVDGLKQGVYLLKSKSETLQVVLR